MMGSWGRAAWMEQPQGLQSGDQGAGGVAVPQAVVQLWRPHSSGVKLARMEEEGAVVLVVGPGKVLLKRALAAGGVVDRSHRHPHLSAPTRMSWQKCGGLPSR